MVRAAVFDAFGTLFDIHSLAAACEAAFPGRGEAINRLWRQKQPAPRASSVVSTWGK